MREILFKAKRKDNGEWVYGDILHDYNNKPCAIRDYCGSNPIVPETVCQYTSLKDKNGVKIFEGDLIRIETVNFDIEGEVVYENGVFQCVNGDIEELLWYHPIEMKVLGNIFDNPELLEV